MARFERLEPRSDDSPLFDGGVEDDEAGEEGSRLPLLIVIALLVLAAFAGVVWLAYTQGVERGRADSPRILVAQGGSPAEQLKVYQQPAPPDEATAGGESVAPPTPAAKSGMPPEATPGAAPSEATPAETPPATASNAAPVTPSTSQNAGPPPANKAPPKPASATPRAALSAAAPPPAQRVATGAPAQLVVPSGSSKSPATASHAAAPQAEAPAETPPPASSEQASAPSPQASVKAGAGAYLLQIGAYKSQDEADAAWHAFETRHPVAGGYQSNVKQVDLGAKGTWYRLRIGSFADKAAASAFCAKLKADGADCLVAK